MNNNLQVFKSEEFGQVRTIVIDNAVWFVGKDVAECLGYSEPRSAISKKIDNEDKGVAKMETPSGKQNMTIINESGFYSLVLGSKLSTAKKFQRWVTSEVLPDIRKHGMYATEDTIDNILNNPDFAITLLTKYKEEKEERKRLEAQNKEKDELLIIAGEKTTIVDEFLSDDGLYSVNDVSKILGIKGLGRNNLYKYLRENKIIMTDTYIDYKGRKQSGARHYEAYASYTNNQQYFEHRVRDTQIGYDTVKQNVAMFTPTGVQWIIKRLQKDGYMVQKDLDTIIEELRELKIN
ncbi:hypothetical protein G8S21_05020 [Clostridium botulinum C]|uniref:phage antirepressor KilAC domain-containing protein n=1 Tax=Clostridium botulinum TaxID=1491 RepID=UPI001E357F19|nr:phage antirepressor KilAC domain-containing protein [Clostridium botulinum]MCD3245311.1 hypothetical protein [Clostridium botulinum C]MCD3261690.1 hypothetical protein [Clostridium botulinum C]